MAHYYRIGLGVYPPPDAVRAVDVALLGPVLIAAGLWIGPLPALLRAVLTVSGAATIAYNWRRLGRP